MNKYEKWYKNIIQSATARQHTEYTERHHIMPRSLGGSDDADNLVSLTAREHFVCHWLLTKIYPTGEEHWRMLNAFRMMRAENPRQQRYQTKITARVYANLKEEYSKLQSEKVSGSKNPMYGKQWTTDQKLTHSKKIKGRVQPLDEKNRQIAAITGRTRAPFSDEWKENLSKNHKSKRSDFNGKMSADTRKKISDCIRGRKQSDEEKEQRRLANIGKKREKVLCPHCQRMIAVNGYARWHGNNCQQKQG